MSDITSEIAFQITLDENQVPEKITWSASDSGDTGACDAAFITIWDKDEKNTLRIDLWTKEMMVDDMQIYFHQMLLSMSDTYARATGDQNISNEMKEFAMQLGEKMGIIKKNE